MVDDYIKELTTMNVFMLIKSRYGELELLTPPADGTVYNGSMRRTIV
jgi:branched-subunit amino acid aminotransferase/4-amino-4-deoxychorismate lyase